MTKQDMIDFICSHLDGKELEEYDAQSDAYAYQEGDGIFLCFRDLNSKERSFKLTVEDATI
tara:strand:+ start:622 stop:804 length:183 start_codon:yes stop_codon:yes gene_type:complete